MTAYYNEFDPRAAAWLRELIAEGHIAAGDVDERSILDVTPNDLRGYTQCHFFAGIGGWSLALRLAGWDDARPVWTGSCPCQPFSAAGAGKGFADERHLWPAWHYLIEQCRPPVLFGEQVEAAIRYGWLDLVRDDLEGIGFAFAAAGLPAACVGAPHIRQRLWFVAHASGQRQQLDAQRVSAALGRFEASLRHDAGGCGRPAVVALADAAIAGRSAQQERAGRTDGRPTSEPGRLRDAVALADGSGARLEWCNERALGVERATVERGGSNGKLDQSPGRGCERLGHQPAHGEPVQANPWRGAEWLACRDGKARPVEPGVFPLAHGVPDRVGLLRGAGNAIVPQVAAAFIEASQEAWLFT